MRSIKTPPSLKWLINKKSRLEGELSSLKNAHPKQLSLLQDYLSKADSNLRVIEHGIIQIQEATKSIPILEKEIDALNTVLKLHEIKINLDLIAPKRLRSQLQQVIPYGGVTSSIFEYLNQQPSQPCKTSEIALYVAHKYQLDIDSENIKGFSRQVRQRLRTLYAEGKVLRLHNQVTCKEGQWMLPVKKPFV
jgi:hypothetical protein